MQVRLKRRSAGYAADEGAVRGVVERPEEGGVKGSRKVHLLFVEAIAKTCDGMLQPARARTWRGCTATAGLPAGSSVPAGGRAHHGAQGVEGALRLLEDVCVRRFGVRVRRGRRDDGAQKPHLVQSKAARGIRRGM